jgi:hypothetical protein
VIAYVGGDTSRGDEALLAQQDPSWTTRDYFAEMYVAGVLADAGWDIYFPRRDRGFDMIVSRPHEFGAIVRPVQVKGKYASDAKTNKNVYGYNGKITAFHDDMILAMPFFTSKNATAPAMIAWLPRAELRASSRGWRCQPATFVNGQPRPRPGYRHFFDEPGLMPFALPSQPTII